MKNILIELSQDSQTKKHRRYGYIRTKYHFKPIALLIMNLCITPYIMGVENHVEDVHFIKSNKEQGNVTNISLQGASYRLSPINERKSFIVRQDGTFKLFSNMNERSISTFLQEGDPNHYSIVAFRSNAYLKHTRNENERGYIDSKA